LPLQARAAAVGAASGAVSRDHSTKSPPWPFGAPGAEFDAPLRGFLGAANRAQGRLLWMLRSMTCSPQCPSRPVLLSQHLQSARPHEYTRLEVADGANAKTCSIDQSPAFSGSS